jgi:hypothetical protein
MLGSNPEFDGGTILLPEILPATSKSDLPIHLKLRYSIQRVSYSGAKTVNCGGVV